MTGSSSLLRPSPAPLVRVAVLGFVALTAAPPLAIAAAHAPDPSPRTGPLTGLAAPDPYPAPRTAPARITPVQARMPAAPAAPAPAKRPRKAPARHVPKRASPRPVTPVEPVRLSDLSAPRFAALAQAAVGPPRHVSRNLVLALGLLVLLSASLVAGAARELAR